MGVTRADLASAYLRLEQAYFAHPPVGEKLVEINKVFDQATLAFFTGRNAEAIRTIDTLTESLTVRPLTEAERAVASLKVNRRAARLDAEPPIARESVE